MLVMFVKKDQNAAAVKRSRSRQTYALQSMMHKPACWQARTQAKQGAEGMLGTCVRPGKEGRADIRGGSKDGQSGRLFRAIPKECSIPLPKPLHRTRQQQPTLTRHINSSCGTSTPPRHLFRKFR
eukprot:1136474-Pelagomonas_calceolata.AAC.8